MVTTYEPGGRSVAANEPGTGEAALLVRTSSSSAFTDTAALTNGVTTSARELITWPMIDAVLRTSAKSAPVTLPLTVSLRVWVMYPAALAVSVNVVPRANCGKTKVPWSPSVNDVVVMVLSPAVAVIVTPPLTALSAVTVPEMLPTPARMPSVRSVRL